MFSYGQAIVSSLGSINLCSVLSICNASSHNNNYRYLVLPLVLVICRLIMFLANVFLL